MPGESPWTEEPAGYSPQGHKESDMTEQPSTEIVILSEISQTEAETSYDIHFMLNLKRHDTNELIYKTETDSQELRE